MHLLSLLSKVSLITDSSDDSLEGTPSVSNATWNSLVGKNAIKESLHVQNSRSHELRLSVADADKDRVNNQEDPAVGEDQGSKEDTGPESKLEAGDKVHASVVVLLDEAGNGLGQWWLWALAWGSISRSGTLAWG